MTHNHPEGIKGAEAAAAAVFLAKTGSSREAIRDHIHRHYYPLTQTLDEIRPAYSFDVSCRGSVPQAIQAFLESESYVDAVRNAVSLGGDSDTQAAIAGAIAWSYYRRTDRRMCARLIRDWRIDELLPEDFTDTIAWFEAAWSQRAKTYARTGACRQITLE